MGGLRQRAELGERARGGDHAQRADVVHRLAVDDGPRPGRVVADHAAEGGPAGGGHVRPEGEAERRQLAVEAVEHHARLHPHPPAGHVDLADAVEVLGAVDDEARPDRLAGQAGAAAAGGDRHAELGRDLHGGDEVVGGAGHDDAERLDLVVAGVGGVQPAGGVVEPDLAGEVAAEVADERVPADGGEVVHPGIVKRSARSVTRRGQRRFAEASLTGGRQRRSSALISSISRPMRSSRRAMSPCWSCEPDS